MAAPKLAACMAAVLLLCNVGALAQSKWAAIRAAGRIGKGKGSERQSGEEGLNGGRRLGGGGLGSGQSRGVNHQCWWDWDGCTGPTSLILADAAPPHVHVL